MLVKTLRDKALEEEKHPSATPAPTSSPTSSFAIPEKPTARLYLTALLGGAVTIYVSMFLLKYKRGDLMLMILMPVLGVLNIYLFVLLFKSGFGFLVMR